MPRASQAAETASTPPAAGGGPGCAPLDQAERSCGGPGCAPLDQAERSRGASGRAPVDAAVREHGGMGSIVALAVFGAVISFTVMGHFVMPHPDFFEFVDSGRAMLEGHLPPTMKRGPVFSLLIAGLGRIVQGEAPELTPAAWLNALLLPLNGVLVYLIGARWIGPAARWAAVAFLVMPMSLYCTAHVIVEPLLVFLILGTLLLAQRGSAWAYVAASLATMTRYDVAGLIPGLFIAEFVARRRVSSVARRSPAVGVALAAWRSAAAAVPLAAWLVLTAATWSTRSNDHYLSQIAMRSSGDIAAALPGGLLDAAVRAVNTVFDSQFEPQRLAMPIVALPLGQFVLIGLTWVIAALAIIGAARKSLDRDAAAVAAVVALLAYLLVHAVFPFQFHRFGYPPAVIVILLAAAGWRPAAEWTRRRFPTRALRVGLACAVISLLALAVAGEAQLYAGMGGSRFSEVVSLAIMAMVATAVVWAGGESTRGGRAAGAARLLGGVLFVSVQVRAAAPLLGSGRELANQVEAARWIRDHAEGAAKVVSGTPGLMRLFAGRSQPERFLGFQDIRAGSWPEILGECRATGVRYIVWHDQLWQEHGQFYAEKWGLKRFEVLGDAANAPGVIVERRYAGYPNLVILRVADAGP